MSYKMKFWISVIFLCCVSLFTVNWLYPVETVVHNSKSPENKIKPFIQDSIAYKKKVVSHDNLNTLFSEMGINSTRLNPCFEIENLSNKYCSRPSMLLLLISEPNFTPVENQLFHQFLESKTPCQDLSEYIGHVCMTRNFKKIVSFFSLKK